MSRRLFELTDDIPPSEEPPEFRAVKTIETIEELLAEANYTDDDVQVIANLKVGESTKVKLDHGWYYIIKRVEDRS